MSKSTYKPSVPLPADEIERRPKAGRGAIANPAGRYERFRTFRTDDGWHASPLPEESVRDLAEPEPEEEKIKTTLHVDASRTVINDVKSPDLAGMRTINPYRGCEHGCIYCFARPSHSWLGFGPGIDFETQIFYKPDAPEILKRELAAPGYNPSVITLGSNTDCFQPAERELKLTRRIIEVLAACNHPLTIITKSGLVTRDIDLLAPMAAKRLASVNVSITTLDPYLTRIMEPRAAAPWKRLATIKALTQAGIAVNVMVAPMIPGLTDMEMEKIMEAAAKAGATSAGYTVVRLPYEVKDLFTEWLKQHKPDRAEHVLSLIKQVRGGKLYDAKWGERRIGKGVYADLIRNRFSLARHRLGLHGRGWDYDYGLFAPPSPDGQLGFSFS